MKRHDVVWPAIMREGQPRAEESAAYRKWVAKAFGEGEEVEYLVRRRSKRGSKEQAGYYFGVVLPTIVEELGYDEGVVQLHTDLTFKFRPYTNDMTGLVRRTRWRDMDQAERASYVTDVITWAEANGWRIPRPNEVDHAA